MCPKVITGISGSTCVVELRPNMELYIDARSQSKALNNIEVVERGQVKAKYLHYKTDAPEFIIKLIKELI